MKKLEKKKAIMKMKELSEEEKKEWIKSLDESHKQTDELKKEFGKFYHEINNIVFGFDPIGIAMKEHKDEYQLEAEEILKKIKKIRSSEELKKIARSIFVESFYKEAVKGRAAIIDDMSEKIWLEWKQYSGK